MISPVFKIFTVLLWRAEFFCFFIQLIGKDKLIILLRKFFQEGSFFFLLFPFSSIQSKLFFANKETFCLFYLVFIFRKNLPFFFKKKESLSWKTFLFFFHQVFLASLFHHFLFLFITFRIRHCFSFPFLLDHLCSWSPSSWTHFSCTSLSVFFEQQFLLQVVSKKTFQMFPFYMHGLPLNVCFAHTLLQIKKKLVRSFPLLLGSVSYIFVFACFVFLFSIFPFLFCARVLKHFSSLFSFLNVVLCWSLFRCISFIENSVWFDHRFSHLFLFSPFTFSPFTKKQSFLNCFLLCCPFFLVGKNVSCLLVL